ncbi:hypothetical protein GGS20DRAFT_547246 [Poronia punctata]|nr:hypothetical protein GGS20DRAFT_547246 [Poronia punctata]
MKFTTTLLMMMMVGVATARPDARNSAKKVRREVPRKSYLPTYFTYTSLSSKGQKELLTYGRPDRGRLTREVLEPAFGAALNLNNIDNIQDPVFALLGNKAAAQIRRLRLILLFSLASVGADPAACFAVWDYLDCWICEG